MTNDKDFSGLNVETLRTAAIGQIYFSGEDKKAIFNAVEQLMRKASIAVRDTWKGWDGENFDDIYANNMMSGGPRSIRFIKVANGKAEFKPALKLELNGFQSYGYEDSSILIPERLASKGHSLIHEVTHFLQHESPSDIPWFGLESETEAEYIKWVSQRSETEAHLVQLMYIAEYEPECVPEVVIAEFKERLELAIKEVALRPGFILYAKQNAIL